MMSNVDDSGNVRDRPVVSIGNVNAAIGDKHGVTVGDTETAAVKGTGVAAISEISQAISDSGVKELLGDIPDISETDREKVDKIMESAGLAPEWQFLKKEMNVPYGALLVLLLTCCPFAAIFGPVLPALQAVAPALTPLGKKFKWVEKVLVSKLAEREKEKESGDTLEAVREERLETVAGPPLSAVETSSVKAVRGERAEVRGSEALASVSGTQIVVGDPEELAARRENSVATSPGANITPSSQTAPRDDGLQVMRRGGRKQIGGR